ncbi:iron-containing alcohol dehydrogenase [Candidatus Symbiopectobacterium sp. NZEC127]|uniref:iron-containing alcohol dehydrogenase n=1 Tax=Candidatus Symbiopectobacterium sp. NZEC127 TaxID=2820472 RepID=UPI002227AFC0|nr:iron-containing alcohol dehydrogenase [Candidatus Symbiopectobacterium sp. NZEC127]MCW2485395.1 iron-containing alcohol dehydrogenase [Candidatus Symbiopectobacterium sp. NZEC127]
MPLSFSVVSPGEIRFGRGEAAGAATWLAARARHVLLVQGANPQRAAFLVERLHAAQVRVSTFTVAHEPTLADIEQGVELARLRGIEAVVSLGGGAVIDAGKAIAALVKAHGPLIDYLEVVGNGRILESAPLTFVALPTTAGTGAEVTKNAVINVPAHRRKVSLRDNRMLPDLAIIDPALTDHTPRSVTLASGLDALTQVIEPYICNRATPYTDALCRAAIPQGINALMQLMKQECPQSRDTLAWVSLCGGLALANAGLGVIHGLAGPLGGLCDAPHGALCGSLLPFGLMLNNAHVTDPALLVRFDEIRRWFANALGVAPMQAFEALRDWRCQVGLGSLSTLGVPHDALESAALAASSASSMKANPVPLTYDQLLGMLHLAWE